MIWVTSPNTSMYNFSESEIECIYGSHAYMEALSMTSETVRAYFNP